MSNPQAQCPDDCEGCAKLVPCWCDPRHSHATHAVDTVSICSDCADGIARAVPLDPALRRTTVSASPPVAIATHATQHPAASDAAVPTSAPRADHPVPGGDADLSIEAARAERDRAAGCMCAAELLVRSDVDRRCPLHGGINTSPRAPQRAATNGRH
jgi:hypothetical protein